MSITVNPGSGNDAGRSPPPETIKALAFDLDGTLLAPGSILTGRSIKAVHALIRRGLKVIIATGRAIESGESVRTSLGAKGPMIYFNGAVVADPGGAGILKTTLLDLDSLEFCVDLSRETGIYFQAYLPVDDFKRIVLIAEKDSPEREMYHNHTGMLAELGDLKKALRQPGVPGCVKGMFLAEPEVQAGIRPKLVDHLGDNAYIVQTYRTFLEVLNAGVSKGKGLLYVMERLGLKKEEVIAFGDEENDLPMLLAAGFSAAPSNSKESVKAAAGIIIGSNADDGVAIFLEDFFSIKKSEL